MDGRTDGRTHGRTDNVKTVYPLQTKFAGGIIITILGCNFLLNWPYKEGYQASAFLYKNIWASSGDFRKC